MQSKNTFELLARGGYAARGVVYLLVGGLALVSAAGGGGQEPGSQDALASLLGQPFGRIILLVIGLGLVAHALWRIAQSLLNADRQKKEPAGYAARVAHLLSALTHGALAVFAIELAIRGSRSGQSSSGGDEVSMTAWLMQQPFGRYLVGAVAIGIGVAGVVQLYRGWSGKFEERLNLPHDKESWLKPVCAYGVMARGVVFLIIGGFLLFAAITVDPQNAGGLPEALAWVRALPFGAALYALLALGLFAFGAYSIVQAIYRRLDAPSVADAKRAVTARI